MTNTQIYEYIKGTPTFEKWMPKVTVDIFTANGFAEYRENALPLLTDFFGLLVRVALNKIMDIRVRRPEFYDEIVEEYASMEGGITQRIYNDELPKPVSPQGFNLEEGRWVNDYVIRKTKQSQRFWKQNFFYANVQTIKEDELQKAFLKENGIAEFVAMKQSGLQKAYIMAKTMLAREVLAGALQADGSVIPALQDSQIFNATTNPEFADIDSSTPVDAQAAYREFINVLDNIAGIMKTSMTINKFNADKWNTAAYEDEHKLLLRFDIYNLIKKYEGVLGSGTGYIKNVLETLPFKVVLVDGLGHVKYVLKSDHTTILKPVYEDNTFQYQIGWNTTGGVGTLADCLPEDQIDCVDDDPDTFAALVQKGAIFSVEQTPYKTQVKQAFLGGYYNLLAKKENEQISYDAHCNIIKFTKAVANRNIRKK